MRIKDTPNNCGLEEPDIVRWVDMPVITLKPASGNNSPVDGRVQRLASGIETFSAIRAGAGTLADPDGSSTGGYMFVGMRATDQDESYYSLDRSIICFDTSELPSDAVIESAAIRLHGAYKTNTLGSSGLHITSASPQSTATLAASDYSRLGTTSYGSISYSSFSDANWNSIELNQNGIDHINKDGVTAYGVRLGWDLSGNFSGTWSPSAETHLWFSAAEDAGGAYAPELVIHYSIYIEPDISSGLTLVPGGAASGMLGSGMSAMYPSSVEVTPSSGLATVSAYSPSVVASGTQAFFPDHGSLSLGTFAPTILMTADRVIATSPAALGIYTLAPVITSSPYLLPPSASLVLSTSKPSVSVSQIIMPSAAEASIRSFAPSMAVSLPVAALILAIEAYAPRANIGLSPGREPKSVIWTPGGVPDSVIDSGSGISSVLFSRGSLESTIVDTGDGVNSVVWTPGDPH